MNDNLLPVRTTINSIVTIRLAPIIIPATKDTAQVAALTGSIALRIFVWSIKFKVKYAIEHGRQMALYWNRGFLVLNTVCEVKDIFYVFRLKNRSQFCVHHAYGLISKPSDDCVAATLRDCPPCKWKQMVIEGVKVLNAQRLALKTKPGISFPDIVAIFRSLNEVCGEPSFFFMWWKLFTFFGIVINIHSS